jgi:hypothetical protein
VSTRCYHYKPFDNLESGDIVFPTVMDCVAVVWVALWLPCGPRCLRHNAPPGMYGRSAYVIKYWFFAATRDVWSSERGAHKSLLTCKDLAKISEMICGRSSSWVPGRKKNFIRLFSDCRIYRFEMKLHWQVLGQSNPARPALSHFHFLLSQVISHGPPRGAAATKGLL